jgi:hypothetical protein
MKQKNFSFFFAKLILFRRPKRGKEKKIITEKRTSVLSSEHKYNEWKKYCNLRSIYFSLVKVFVNFFYSLAEEKKKKKIKKSF